MSLNSLPQLLSQSIEEHASTLCFYRRTLKGWLKISAVDMDKIIQSLQHQFIEAGVKKGDAFGIMSPSSPHWLAVDAAIQSLGAITVPLFYDLSPEVFEYEIKDSQMKFIYIEGGEDFKSLELPPSINTCFVYHPPSLNTDVLVDLSATFEMPPDDLKSESKSFSIEESLAREDVATIIYTSGSTGMPKGVVLTHGNILSQVEGAGQLFPMLAKKDKVLSCLPLPHVFERMVMAYYISRGLDIHFADDVKKVGIYLKEIKPTVMTMVPRLLEKVHGKFYEGVQSSSGLKKFVATYALRRAKNSEGSSFLDGVYDKLVYQKFRAAFGGHLRMVICGGSALSRELNLLLNHIGVPVYQGYGLTESSPVIAVNSPGANKPGFVGRVFPGVKVKISSEGEVLARGANIMLSYHNNSEATAQSIDSEGWLKTGDKGSLDDEGYLSITGRIKEMMKTSGGKYVSPVSIELALCRSRWVDMAMVVADNKKFVSALIFIDVLKIPLLKKKLNLSNLEDGVFFEHQKLISFFENIVKKINPRLNRWEQIIKFKVLANTLSSFSGELTPTMKIKRHEVLKKHKHFIDLMYNDI